MKSKKKSKYAYKQMIMKTPNLWDSVKAVIRGRFIAKEAFLKKQEKNQIHNLTLHLEQLEKEEMKQIVEGKTL